MSHWHFDHNNGNSAYREAYPGVTIVSERDTRDWIELNSTWWSRMATAPGSAKRVALEKLEAQLRTGCRQHRPPIVRGGAQGRSQDNVTGRREASWRSWPQLKVVPPNLVFDRELTLWLGRRRVELRAQGRANSPNDVTIYLPDDRVLFTGDILVQDPLPYVGHVVAGAMGGGAPAGWRRCP